MKTLTLLRLKEARTVLTTGPDLPQTNLDDKLSAASDSPNATPLLFVAVTLPVEIMSQLDQ